MCALADHAAFEVPVQGAIHLFPMRVRVCNQQIRKTVIELQQRLYRVCPLQTQAMTAGCNLLRCRVHLNRAEATPSALTPRVSAILHGLSDLNPPHTIPLDGGRGSFTLHRT